VTDPVFEEIKTSHCNRTDGCGAISQKVEKMSSVVEVQRLTAINFGLRLANDSQAFVLHKPRSWAPHLCAKCFHLIPLQPKYAIMPLQTSTSRAYKLPYHHLQEVGLDYRESYGGISVIPPRTRTTSAVTRKTPRSASLPLLLRVSCHLSCRANFSLVVPTFVSVQDPISRINQETEWQQQKNKSNPIHEFQLLRARGIKEFSTICMHSTRRMSVLSSHSMDL